MRDSKKYSEKDRKRDHDIIVFGMIEILYNLEKINRPTFEAIKKKMGSEVVNGELSRSYFEDLRAKIETRRNQKEDSFDTFGLIFMRVENGELMVTEACKQLSISRSTYYRQYRKWKAEQLEERPWQKEAHTIDTEMSQRITEYNRNQKIPASFEQMFKRVENRELMVIEACDLLYISKSTYYRHYCKWKTEQVLE